MRWRVASVSNCEHEIFPFQFLWQKKWVSFRIITFIRIRPCMILLFFSIFLQKFHHFSYSKRIECWRNFATHLKHTRIPWSAIEWARIVVVSIFYSTSDHSFEHDSHFLCLSRNIFNLVTLVTIVRQHRFPHVHHRTRFKNELIFWLSNAASEQQKGGIVAV